MQHTVLVAKPHIAQQPLSVSDGGVPHNLVCRQNVHGLGLECLGLPRRQPSDRQDHDATAQGRIWTDIIHGSWNCRFNSAANHLE